MYKVVCKVCGKEFEGTHPAHKICSIECLRKKRDEYNKKRKQKQTQQQSEK